MMDCSRPGSSAHGISQARILEWVVFSSSRGIFLTQGWNPYLLHWQVDSLPLSHRGSPRVSWLYSVSWLDLTWKWNLVINIGVFSCSPFRILPYQISVQKPTCASLEEGWSWSLGQSQPSAWRTEPGSNREDGGRLSVISLSLNLWCLPCLIFNKKPLTDPHVCSYADNVSDAYRLFIFTCGPRFP